MLLFCLVMSLFCSSVYTGM